MPKLPGNKDTGPMGFGTWRMGGGREPDSSHDQEELAAISYALDHGITALDTAELYGGGHAEELIARALKGRDREQIHLTTKVLPEHFDREQMFHSCRKSLARLGVQYVDLYLLHWPPDDPKNIPVAVRAMEDLVKEGLVRSIGVSNFDVEEMKLALEATSHEEIVANQVQYSLVAREVEREVVPFCEQEGITVISYTPLGRGKVAELPAVQEIARKRGKTPIQVALNYLLRHTFPIPKAVQLPHLEEVLGALGWELTKEEWHHLQASPPPPVSP